MKLEVKFSESVQTFAPKFGEVNNVSDGGFERGYVEGYADGRSDGRKAGYEEGLAARTYETWTVTYVDGTVEEKEMALL